MRISLRRFCVAGLLVAAAAISRFAAADEPPVSLISYDGQRPVALAPTDPLMNSVGVLFVDGPEGKKYDPETEGYATAFLVSECHALTGTANVSALPATERSYGGSEIIVDGLTLGIGLKPGFNPDTVSRDSFRTTWPVTVKKVIPDSLNQAGSMLSGWWLLQLQNCTPGAAGNGTPLAFDPVTSPELIEMGLPQKARHVGVLMTDQLSLVEVPSCDILGQIRNLAWESTCSSWLGMQGGPVLMLDAKRKAWTAVGMIPLGNPVLLLNPSDHLDSRGRTFTIYPVDAKNPRFYDYTTNIVPMAQIWPWIRDDVENDHPGLADPQRIDVAEPKLELRQLLLMAMQKRPEKDWSAADSTRFGIALKTLEYYGDTVRMFRSAVRADPTYLSAAFQLSLVIAWAGPAGITDQDLATIRDALDSAIKAYPEDPQLFIGKIAAEQRLGEFDKVIADSDAYVAAFPPALAAHATPSWMHEDRGDAYLALGDLDKAEAEFQHARDKDATDGEAFRGLAQVAYFRGDISNAERLARKSLMLDCKCIIASAALALARARAGDFDGAIAEAEQALEMPSSVATSALWLAVLRAYKRAMTDDNSDAPLLTEEEMADISPDHWAHRMAEVYLGTRTLESMGDLGLDQYIASYRRSVSAGRLAFSAAFDLSQGRTIDVAKVEEDLLKHRDTTFALLAPLLKDWNDRVAAQQ